MIRRSDRYQSTRLATRPRRSRRAPAARVLATLLASVALAGCGFPELFHGEARQVEVKGQSITLAWDPPPAADRMGPASYEVYVAPVGTTDWEFLAEVAASDNPRYRVRHSEVGSGRWVFAVRAIMADDRMSEYHASVDATADPIGGWYVYWPTGTD